MELQVEDQALCLTLPAPPPTPNKEQPLSEHNYSCRWVNIISQVCLKIKEVKTHCHETFKTKGCNNQVLILQ